METHKETESSRLPQQQQQDRITGQDPPRQQLQVRRRLDGPSKLVSSSLLFLAVISSAGIVSVLTAPRSAQRTCDKSRTIVDGRWGQISDDSHPYTSGNYTQNTHCEWLIQPNRSKIGLNAYEPYFISLTFTQMNTECAYDYVFVYDGNTPDNSLLLGSFSGRTQPSRLLGKSGAMTIVLFSDTNYVLEGFRAEFSVTSCPHNCTRHGVCIDHVCSCEKNWSGPDCSLAVCSENCGNGSGRGKCSSDGTRCECHAGFSGDDCSLDENNFIGNTWHYLSRNEGGPFAARASHASAYDGSQDSLFIYGGFDLNSILSDFLVYKFLDAEWSTFDFSQSKFNKLVQNEWQNSSSHILQSKLNANKTVGNLSDSSRRPPPLFGHAMENVPGGFVIFGGMSPAGLKNDLWFFNIVDSTFEQKATESSWKPPPLSEHTLTQAEGYLYAFGGSTLNGKFSRQMFRINETSLKEWEPVEARGTKVSDLRVTGHTMVYSELCRCFILYGGIHADVARFSRLSDQMFIFSLESLSWAELDLPKRPRPYVTSSHIPPERAYHSAKILGNYMIVFGGYSHHHNDVEACHDDKLYFFHLGCHVWVSERVLEHSPHGRRYPKNFGLFGHSASVRKKNTLLISGGYHGSVSSGVLAYIFPFALAMTENDKVCTHYGSQASCSANPECGWCPSDGVCYLRTLTGRCASNLQTTSCPGICPGLTDCLSCTIHGNGTGSGSVVVDALGLGSCTWCSHLSSCMPRMTPHVCSKQENTWWTDAVKINSPSECYVSDFTPGITLLKYYNPPNFSYPDEVSIVNISDVEFRPVNRHGLVESSGTGKFVSRILGSVRVPSDAGKRNLPTERMSACVDYASMVLRASHSAEGALDLIQNSVTSERQAVCPEFLRWPEDESPFFLFPGSVFRIDFVAERNATSPTHLPGKASKMVLKSSRGGQHFSDAQPLNKDYLEPYRNGTDCPQHDNCLACTSDMKCGWCASSSSCLSRETRQSNCEQHLTLLPSRCVNCSSHIYCENCVNGGDSTREQGGEECEWIQEEARCVRRGRFAESVRSIDQCPSPCHMRDNCSTCVGEPGRCVWCEDTQECFLFSVYTSKYKYGSCKQWIDKDFVMTSQQLSSNSDSGPEDENQMRSDGQCSSCEFLPNCSTCLQRLGCGWCYDPSNPTIGKCMKGGFGGSSSQCLPVNTTDPDRRWDYGSCPDIDECALDLHNCHPNATCINKRGSFECQCNKGFIGDGKKFCEATCFDECVHGRCSQGPDFKCICDIGWTGPDCSIDCGCHGHSTCLRGVGLCDDCIHNTTGERCDLCVVGSYGNATDAEIGCTPCQCNGHEDLSAGVCDRDNGSCFCLDHTEGENCQKCATGFYGDPKLGGHCYHACSARKIISHEREGHVGSYSLRIGDKRTKTDKLVKSKEEERVFKLGPPRKCLWIISPKNISLEKGPISGEPQSIIQLRLERSTDFTCENSYVHVYDGLPRFVSDSWSTKTHLLGSFCGGQDDAIVEAYSGVMSVFYSDDAGAGFNASFSVLDCPYHCKDPNRKCDESGNCVCKEGLSGPRCSRSACPNECGKSKGRGLCHPETNLCQCSRGYGGLDCSRSLEPCGGEAEFRDLDHMETAHSPLPRFGGSLLADRRGTLWVFGGFSMTTGSPLNDIRAFDTKVGTWLPVTVQHDDVSPPALPPGRYFHASAFLQDTVYVYGGLSEGSHYLQDFWKFNVLTRTWEDIPNEFRKKLAGHTMTVNEDEKTLVVIGGMSDESGFNDLVFEYIPSKNQWHIIPTQGYRVPLTGIYGHSTVYHASHKAFYVYGGLAFDPDQGVKSSGSLFSLHYPSGKWALLPLREARSRPQGNIPQGRYFHSAVTTKNYMLLFGGKTDTGFEETRAKTPLSPTAIYVYRCSLWIDLTNDGRDELNFVGSPPVVSVGSSATVANDDEIFILGGFFGQLEGGLKRLTVPPDFCRLISNECKSTPGCGSAVLVDDFDKNTTFCYSNALSKPTAPCSNEASGGALHYSNGILCEGAELSERRDCSEHKTCGECLSDFPMPDATKIGAGASTCRWCAGCNKGRCVPLGAECRTELLCQKQDEVTDPSKCPVLQCSGSDCDKCNSGDPECFWTRSVQRLGDQTRIVSQTPLFDWTCERKSPTLDIVNRTLLLAGTGNASLNSVECPIRCHLHDNCKDCLDSNGAEGGWNECRWSEKFGCTSPNELPLRCLTGLCGRILSGNPEQCPAPCSSYGQCSSCLQDPNCGWCALDSGEMSGIGVCVKGTLESPKFGHCDLANFTAIISPTSAGSIDSMPLQRAKDQARANLLQTSWHYLTCPREDECSNGHHDCDPVSEVCIDNDDGFSCDCNVGYNRTNDGDDDSAGTCEPVCQACVHGDCVKPGECRCHFSYVGESCDTPCKCNGHSECAGLDKLDVCLDCQNNTMGSQCQFCKPFFVGDPRNGSGCLSCSDYCNGHTDFCFANDESVTKSSFFVVANASTSSSSEVMSDSRGGQYLLDAKSLDVLIAGVTRGPIGDAICVNCGDMTIGATCERCASGHFRGGPSPDSPCLQCDCNGHGNVCDEMTGGDCQCQNNTISESDQCGRRKTGQDVGTCHQYQCTKCKEYYIGSPEKQHQCYRQMTVDTEYCFDPVTQSECNRSPRPLPNGDTVFFAVLPKFMNVDIRVVIDVAVGAVDVIFSPEPQMLIVETNSSTWRNEILLDPSFNVVPYDSDDQYEAVKEILRLRYTKAQPENPDDVEVTSDPPFEIEEEDDYPGPIDQLLDDGPKFQPPFFGHLDDFSSLSALLRFHRQQRRTGRKNLVAQLAANATLFSPSGTVRQSRRHRRYKLITRKCDDRLGTYVRLDDPASVLQVIGLKNRLVISLPEGRHDLRTTRFFMAIRGAWNATSVRIEKRSPDNSLNNVNSNSDVKSVAGSSYGSIYFRQDQLHIDLFVFFSVFFSCFFLFLSICVLVWKVKAVSDMRQARRRHAVEMQHMARRPFAKQAVILDYNNAFMMEPYRHGSSTSASRFPVTKAELNTANKRSHQRLLMHSSNAVRDFGTLRSVSDGTDDSGTLAARPVSFEPTYDGLAAVSTFLIQMPHCAAVQKANGQSLISFGCVLVSTGNGAKAVQPVLPQKPARRRNLSSDASSVQET